MCENSELKSQRRAGIQFVKKRQGKEFLLETMRTQISERSLNDATFGFSRPDIAMISAVSSLTFISELVNSTLEAKCIGHCSKSSQNKKCIQL